jgi:hypothetical protein
MVLPLVGTRETSWIGHATTPWWTIVRSKTRMRVELTVPESIAEPRLWVEHQQVLALVLLPGSVEWGLRLAFLPSP